MRSFLLFTILNVNIMAKVNLVLSVAKKYGMFFRYSKFDTRQKIHYLNIQCTCAFQFSLYPCSRKIILCVFIPIHKLKFSILASKLHWRLCRCIWLPKRKLKLFPIEFNMKVISVLILSQTICNILLWLRH